MIEKADALFYKLEEKLITLLSEREDLIREKHDMKADNESLKKELDTLKAERELSAKKLFELLNMVESAQPSATLTATTTANEATHHVASTHEHFSPSLAAIKPLVAQGQM